MNAPGIGVTMDCTCTQCGTTATANRPDLLEAMGWIVGGESLCPRCARAGQHEIARDPWRAWTGRPGEESGLHEMQPSRRRE